MQNIKRLTAIILSITLIFVTCLFILPQDISAATSFVTVSSNNSYDNFGSGGTNLVLNKSAMVYAVKNYNGTKRNYASIDSWSAQNKKIKMNDGDFNTIAYLSDNAEGNNNVVDVYVVYDLGKSASIANILIASQQYDSGADCYLGRYDIYVSDKNDFSKSSQYTDSEKVFSFNSANDGNSFGQYITLENVKGRYVSIHITKCGATNKYPNLFARVGEIAIYETSATKFIEINVNDNYSDFAKDQTNAALGKQVELFAHKNSNGSERGYESFESFDFQHSATNISDGDFSSAGFLSDSEESGEEVSESYIVYDFGEDISITNILIATYVDDVLGNCFIDEYDIYLSSTKDYSSLDDYLSSDKIFSFNSQKNGSSYGQYISLEKAFGRYLAINIKKVSGGNFARIGEIAVFQSEITPVYPTDKYEKYGVGEINLIKEKKPTVYAVKTFDGTDKEYTSIESWSNDNKISKITDGDILSNAYLSDAANGNNNVIESYVVFDLKSLCTINKFLIVAQNYLDTSDCYLGSYDVYLSATSDYSSPDDYNDDDIVFRFNAEKDGASFGQYVNLKGKKGRYLSIHITKASATDTYKNLFARIGEISAYGDDGMNYKAEYIAENVDDWTHPEKLYNNEQFASLGNNLLLNAEPILMLNGSTNSTLDWYNSGKLNDGDVTVSTAFQNWRAPASGEPYMDIIYYLGEDPISIDKMAYIGFMYPWKHYYTGKYYAYVAEDFDDLFLTENVVYEYEYNSQQVSRGQIVTFKNNPEGCYFAIRIVQPNITEFDTNTDGYWECPKISEIGLYGEKATVIEEPMNHAENKPVNVYLTESKNNKKDISDKVINAASVALLTDSDRSVDLQIDINGNQLEIVYNLCNDMLIDKVLLSSADGIDKYSVYASVDYGALWNESSKLFDYNGDPTITSFSQSIKMRYVRILIPAENKKTIGISEIEIIGLNRQQLKNKNIARSLTVNSVELFTQNFTTGNNAYLQVTAEMASKMFDGDANSPIAIEGGDPQKNSINIKLYLGDLKIINSLNLCFYKKLCEYQPGAVKVYVGETEKDILSSDAVPVGEWDYSTDGYMISFAPR